MTVPDPAILTETRRGSVAVLDLSDPPSHALDAQTCGALIAALEAAAADDAISAVVLAAAGGTAFAGDADALDAPAPEDAAALADLTATVAGYPKPVVACLAGTVRGAGAALALAAHWRVVADGARIGWGDVALGRVPGGGATQRLPRLVGARAALDLLLSGRGFPLNKPMLAGLVDLPVEGGEDIVAAAVAFASGPDCVVRPTDTRREGLADGAAYSAEIAERREKTGEALDDAAAQTVAAVEAAALLPIPAGLNLETSVAADCAASPLARARTGLAKAEARVTRAAGAPARGPLTIAGSGRIAAGLAIAVLDAGCDLRLVGAGASRVRAQVAATYDHAVSRSRLSTRKRDDRMRRVSLDTGWHDLGPGDVVFVTDGSAAFEDGGRGTVQATAVPEPEAEDEIALAVPPLCHVRRLVEIGWTEAQADDVARVAAACAAFARLPVVTRGAGARAFDRLSAASALAADALVKTGLPPERLDAALRAAGWASVPFLSRDLAGLPGTGPGVALQECFPDAEFGALDALLAEVGRTGRIAGAGYYDYASGRPMPDPSVTAILSELANPVDPGWDADDIVWMMTAAIANEGVRLVAEGMVDAASDVDLIAVHGMGLPRDSGGLLLWADLQGLPRMERRLRDMADRLGPLWSPHPEWGERIKNGRALVEAG
ncbi:enoyl-CoA hydratase-related protein [Pseudaestuariivita atlantica]|uniref:3-hydroxyacyl-CoA dehydrogenase n=1 Tax=Pseudaestuariivita atlantica TaxID=1317121 RepID=A0A0L1JTD9_9RHOB|nr:enoyl-CoA hydratase-related protein [Pseudaestuariivita atlantica]KNG95010.1 hypothetical protein ATO11_06525 [Pseudaestuariivita atlantica]